MRSQLRLVFALILLAQVSAIACAPLVLIDRFSSNLASSYTSGGSSLSLNEKPTGISGSTCFYMTVKADGHSAALATTRVDEVFLVTNISGSGPYTYTVTGAEAGTSASNHSSGATAIGPMMTADAFAQLIGSGAVTSVNGLTGPVVAPTYNTAAITAIVTGDWTTIGSGGTRTDTTGPGGGGAINILGSTGNNTVQYGLSHTVAAGDFTHYVIISPMVATSATSRVMVGFYDGTKMEGCGAQSDGNNLYQITAITADKITTGASVGTPTGAISTGLSIPSSYIFQLTRTGTTLDCSLSYDGGISYWRLFHDTGPFLTASSVIVTAGAFGTNGLGKFTLLSYQ